jgi:hypothetical protein
VRGRQRKDARAGVGEILERAPVSCRVIRELVKAERIERDHHRVEDAR